MRLIIVIFFLCCMQVVIRSEQQNIVAAGAEVCHMTRMRQGGTHQNGQMNGVRISYDRIKPASWYAGIDYFNGQAQMDGHTGSGRPLLSTIEDTILEGRGGFTLQGHAVGNPFFTLFGGYGIFKETNDFCYPTIVPLTFTERFRYIAAGFLSGVNLSTLISLGCNFKMMFMLDGTSSVTNDPGHTDVMLQMTNELNIRVELPILISPQCTRLNLSCACVPFAEFRHFGGREGFPYNFIDTKFALLGSRLSLVSSF